MTNTEPQTIVSTFYASLAAKDGPAVNALIVENFAEDATVHLPESLPYGGTISGRSTLANALGGMASSPTPVGPANLVVSELLSTESSVAAHVQFDWFAPGSESGVPSQAVELWTFRNGKVQTMRAFYWDTAALVRR